MGKFHRILDPGLAILLPIVDRIKYVKSLKEVAVEIPTQSAITQGKLLTVFANHGCRLPHVLTLPRKKTM